MRDGVTAEQRDRIKTLERENRELRQANEILRKASAYFAPPLIAASGVCRAARRLVGDERLAQTQSRAVLETAVQQ